ncbi:MAG TPA: PRC-barrel domain-containing protein [Dongiaceae bacterium]|nr:PRC-barrel domain-containing protein [Dongiaceae bacterium]
MKRALLAAGAAIFLASLQPSAGIADTTTSVTNSSETDAGALIGKKVVDANNDTVGKIDSVLVNADGKVNAVVVDVSSWLESKKLVSVEWSDLKLNADGNVVTSLSKDQAKQAADYNYKNEHLRGHVFTSNNELYQTNGEAASQTAANTQTDTTAEKGQSGLKNSDGSVNASEVIGLQVRNPENQSVGKISEVLLNNKGSANGVIVDVGGFLGMGTHPVRLKWNEIQLHENGSDDFASTSMTKDQLKQLPIVKR